MEAGKNRMRHLALKINKGRVSFNVANSSRLSEACATSCCEQWGSVHAGESGRGPLCLCTEGSTSEQVRVGSRPFQDSSAVRSLVFVFENPEKKVISYPKESCLVGNVHIQCSR